ncbi:alanine racemase [Kamptonema cortianum]|nr:alanine racemase [Kamptonema cortianum]
MDLYPRTWADIDLTALQSNLGVLRKCYGSDVKIGLVCKADAYGHGLVPVARAAMRFGADVLAVATVQEGVALRDAGVDSTIMVMSPILPLEVEQAVFYGLEVFTESLDSLNYFNDASLKLNRPAICHLKVDTGLHRLGCSPTEVLDILESASGLNVTIKGLASHFLDSAGNPERTAEQLATFNELIESIHPHLVPPEIHICNSVGAKKFENARFTLIRTGLHAYGIDPDRLFGGELQPVMRWHARVMSLRTISAGESVSYAATWIAPRKSVIATLGVGYGDGYPRNLSNLGKVMLNDHFAPVVGLVCMDQVLIDVTDVPGVAIGQTAELLGTNVLVADLAKATGTTPLEIVTRVMSRVSRRYIYPDR